MQTSRDLHLTLVEMGGRMVPRMMTPEAGSKNNRVEIDVAENAAVDAVLAVFLLPAKLIHLVLRNGVFVPPDERAKTALLDGDVLAIWPPIAGG